MEKGYHKTCVVLNKKGELAITPHVEFFGIPIDILSEGGQFDFIQKTINSTLKNIPFGSRKNKKTVVISIENAVCNTFLNMCSIYIFEINVL